jgi:hypothetical protein
MGLIAPDFSTVDERWIEQSGASNRDAGWSVFMNPVGNKL